MIKTILPSAFGFNDKLAMLVDVHSRGVDSGWMSKRAAAGIFKDADIKPEKDHSFIHLIAMGDAETYGCFFEGALVTTDRGLVPIEDIVEGDLVLTHKNRYRKVTQTFCTDYEGSQVDVELRGVLDMISCTPNHPVLVIRHEDLSIRQRFVLRNAGELSSAIDELVAKAQFVASDTLRPNDFVVIPCSASIPWVPPVEFDPYIAGVYVAEGCLVKEYKPQCKATVGTYTKLLFTLSDKDEAVISYIDNWLISLGREPVAHQRSYTSDYGIRIGFGMVTLAPVFDGLFGHMATDKFLSPKIFSLSREAKLKFLAGYFDGDGCVTHGDDRYTGTLTASTASLSLLLDVQRLLGSLGITSSAVRCYNRAANGCFGRGDHVIYQLNIGSKQSNVILEHCLRLRPHTHTSTYRGGGSIQASGNYLLVPVDKIILHTCAHAVKYNLEVEEDNSFVVGVSVHNSNRNGDIFCKQATTIEVPEPEKGKSKFLKVEKGNVETHKTFETHGKVYRHHKNSDPKKSHGDVVKSAHNNEMNRVELIIKVPDATWGDELQKLASGVDVPFSMSCRIPHDSCFTADTLITMDDGLLRPIAAVHVGDRVQTHLGSVSEVTATFIRNYTGPLQHISVAGIPEVIRSTPNHPFLILPRDIMFDCAGSTGSGKSRRHTLITNTAKCSTCGVNITADPAWVPAVEVRADDHVLFPVNRTKGCIIEPHAYIMGIYTGDGCICEERRFVGKTGPKRPTSISISLDSRDLDIQAAVKTAAEAVVGRELRYYLDKGKQAVSLRMYSTDFTLRVLALLGRYSRGKHLDSSIFRWDDISKSKFIAGYIDSDGSIDPIKHTGRICTVNRQLAEDVQKLLWSLCIYAPVHTESVSANGYSHNGTLVHVIHLNAAAVAYFAPYSVKARRNGSSDVRPSVRSFVYRDYICLRVIANGTEVVDDLTVHNLAVAGAESYIAGSCIVHNCSICGHQAKTRREYCHHLKENMGEITKSGHAVGAINDGMVYFDISQVTVPADRTAYGLLKVASDSRVIGGAELAESMDLFMPEDADDYILGGTRLSKLAMIRKLSEIEKEIEAMADGDHPLNKCRMAFDPEVTGDIPDTDIKKMRVPRNQVGDVLGALADVKISLSLRDFMKMILGDRFSEVAEHVDSAQSLLPGIFGRLLKSPAGTVSGMDDFDLSDGVIPRQARETIHKLTPEHSLDDEPVRRRITLTVLRGKAPVPLRSGEQEKTSGAISALAERMATAYSMYKVSFCQREGVMDRTVTERAILQHYIK